MPPRPPLRHPLVHLVVGWPEVGLACLLRPFPVAAQPLIGAFVLAGALAGVCVLLVVELTG